MPGYLLCGRSHHPTLGRSGIRVNHLAIGLQHPCLQPLPYKTKEGPIVDTQPEHGEKPAMIHVVKESFDIYFYHIAVATVLEIEGQVADRVLRPFVRSIRITERKELLLIDCLQYLSSCLR